MRGRHWTQCIRRGSVVLLLALAGFVSLAHAAQHLGEVSDCPMCVQGCMPAVPVECLCAA